MSSKLFVPNRRDVVRGMAVGSGALLLPPMSSQLLAAFYHQPGRFAEELTLTPNMTEGPFYPDKLPLDTDNDLLIINDAITPAVGQVTHLTGRVLSRSGEPVRGALVEIWQVDHNGSYIHSKGGNPRNDNKRDTNFQGYGRFLTDQKGQYYFRTIKPVTYPGRTPHIHYRISVGDKKLLSTQLLINGHAQNEGDGLFRRIKDEKLRRLLVADFNRLHSSKIGELAANFDLVVGYTPKDD